MAMAGSEQAMDAGIGKGWMSDCGKVWMSGQGNDLGRKFLKFLRGV